MKLNSRRIGGKLIRIGTPVERAIVASPSNNKGDMMLLPGYSLHDQENDLLQMYEGMSRASLNMQSKQVEKANQNATSGSGKKVRGIL